MQAILLGNEQRDPGEVKEKMKILQKRRFLQGSDFHGNASICDISNQILYAMPYNT